MGERDIFHAALALADPAQRSAFLDQACAGDPALKDHIQALLQAHGQVGSFLEEQAAGPPAANVDEPIPEGPGTVLGPYKLLEPIGEGGFGIVFLAEQQQPIRRKVALKVLKPGMDSRQVIARFEAERQALALMDHPNIAKVLHAGQTPGGRPYFVMDLVKGIPLTDYCDQARLSVRERLDLFVHVGQAVQHAHQKGIIHRDLKPSNILVTEQDDSPLVKVIDFGIAKALGQQLTDKTLFTGFAQVIGTPLYMSPEQAALGNVDVDTRSDIYSLGVVLYELLTGTTPLDRERLNKANYDEWRCVIREEEPPRPSTRVSTLRQAAATVAARRQSDPKRLSRLFRGELDWVVMKCLEKDRNCRYETAGALAADVERYLHDEPVQACPPSAWYRVRKLAWRYRAALATAVLLLVVLVAGVVVSAWQAIQARRAEIKAIAEETHARKAAAKANAIKDFLIKDLLEQAGAEKNPVGAKVTVLELLDKAATSLEQRRKFADEPEVEAAIHQMIGDTYPNLGRYDKGEAHARRAVTLYRETLGADHPDTLGAMDTLALALDNQRHFREAEALYREAWQGLRRVRGEEHADTLRTLSNMVRMMSREGGRVEEAEPLARQCLEAQLRVLGEDNRDTVDTLSTMCWLLRDAGRFEEAERFGRRSAEASRRVSGPQHYRTIEASRFLAWVLEDQARWAEADRLYREILDDARVVFGPEHSETLAIYNDVGWVLVKYGKWAEAEQICRKTLEDYCRTAGPNGADVPDYEYILGMALLARGQMDNAERLFTKVIAFYRRQGRPDDFPRLSRTLALMALVHQAHGKWEEAEPLHRQVCKDSRRVTGEHNPDTLVALYNYAVLLHASGQGKEAEKVFQQALQVLPADHPWTAQALFAWGNFLLDRGEAQKAAEALHKALPIQRQALIKDHVATGQTQSALGWALTSGGCPKEGEPLLQEALAVCRQSLPKTSWVTADTESRLGACWTALGQFQKAEPLLLKALTTVQAAPVAAPEWAVLARVPLLPCANLQTGPGAPPTATRDALERVIQLYVAWGKPEKAASWRPKRPTPP
jgi:serine/threonine protein kinase/tetratricopeptide (TPR) repeat protein